MKINNLQLTAIQEAARLLRHGGVVAFPTETVYGLGANALDPAAVTRIFELKGRPSFDPLIVHIASADELDALCTKIDDGARKLAKCFWPGPLTLILPKRTLIPDIVTSGLTTVGIRMPAHPVALELIRQAGCPVAAPSANKFGQVSPTTAQHVHKQLPWADYILDGGSTQVGLESTIISIGEGTCTILRPGAITEADIREVLPEITITNGNQNGVINAPGMLKSHYAPRKPFYIFSPAMSELPAGSGIIVHSDKTAPKGAAMIIRTSANGNLNEVAANLFSAMHTLEDEPHISSIFFEAVEEVGLGVAIMDRVKKAAYQYLNERK